MRIEFNPDALSLEVLLAQITPELMVVVEYEDNGQQLTIHPQCAPKLRELLLEHARAAHYVLMPHNGSNPYCFMCLIAFDGHDIKSGFIPLWERTQ